MIETIIASVVGSAASSILGGGSKSQTLPAKFDRSPARFRRNVENVMEPDTRGIGKITRRICFGRYNSNTYQSSRGDA
jgi:hypothetical protein